MSAATTKSYDLKGSRRRDSFANRGWLLKARAVFLGVALVSLLFSFLRETQPSNVELFAASILGGLFLGSLLTLRWLHAAAWWQALQLGSDIALVSAAVYLSGGPISPFLFLYLFPVIEAAVFFSRFSALLVAGFGSLAYAGLLFLIYKGLVIMPGVEKISMPQSGQVILQLIGLSSAMILIAVCTDYLVSRLEESKAAFAAQGELLSASNERARTVVEGIGHGVITLDKKGKVISVSQSSQKYFKLASDELIGLDADKVLKHLSLDQREVSQLNLSATLVKDLTFKAEVEVAGNKLYLQVVLKPMIDAAGEGIGTLLLIQDRTQEQTLTEQIAMQEKIARLLSDAQISQSSEIKLANFIGESPVMKKVFNLIARAAPTEATVLISGESGTGKELVARAIHLGSPRARFPFVAVNCGAIPENLIESELFGHRKGSFTGAESEHLGLVRHAEGGTLFLDEIGELPLQMQAKLLRMIQQRSVRPVGGERDIPINVRIVSATNKNLKRETEKGLFREDLYYRLNVVNLNLPPLRERKEDLPLLINHTLKKLTKNTQVPVIPPASTDLLLRYSYPGNVRELENILERAIVLGGEVILPEHLPDAMKEFANSKNEPQRSSASFSTSGSVEGEGKKDSEKDQRQATQFIFLDQEINLPLNLDLLLDTVERRCLEAALTHAKGTRKHAAELLGINFRSLRYRLQKFGMREEG